MTISIILIDSNNEAKEFTETNAMFDLEQDFLIFIRKDICFILFEQFVSELRQVGGSLRILRFPPPIKLTATL